MLSFKLLALYFFSLLLSVCNTKKTNPLNGQHLRVVVMEYSKAMTTIRNETGHVIHSNGNLKHHFLALSEMFNFSYSFLPVIAPLMEGTQNTRGSLDYLISNETDFLLGACIPTPYRFKFADFPASWDQGEFNGIIPYPREKLNVAASLKPLSYEAWISTIAAGFVTIVFLHYSIKNQSGTNEKIFQNQKSDFWQITNFVLRNLVSQGQRHYSSRLAFRIAAGAWCCGCFFLVQIYSSTLTSHLTSPNQKPIATSVEELVNTPGLSFTVQRNNGLDVALQSANFGDLKKIADNTNKDPKFRCNLTTECLEIVRKGYAGFGSSKNSLRMILDEDLKTTGTCHYYLMKDVYLRLPVFTPLRKNSPFTEMISIGTLRIHQTGLSVFWGSWYAAKPWRCMEINHRTKIPRLSIGHLSSAFLILFIGYVLSFVIFCFENVKSNHHFPKP